MAALALLAGGLGADEKLVRRYFGLLQKMPYVDTHTHTPPPNPYFKSAKEHPYTVYRMLGEMTYVAEFLSGADWPALKASLAANAQHAYYRPFVLAMRDLYGLGKDEELSEKNVERISRAMQKAHQDPAWYGQVLDRARVTHLLWMDAGLTYTSKADLDPRFYPVANIDGLVYVTGRESEKSWKREGGKGVAPPVIRRVEKAHGRKFKSAADLAAYLDASIRGFKERGGVCLKTTSAYFRALDFEPQVDQAAAERAFAKVLAGRDLAAAEEKLLQDYLMLAAFKAARDLKMPFQVHTGNQQQWGMLQNANPLGLNKLLYSGAFYDVPFVLLHGGYPFVSESVMLARSFPHLTLDLCWMSLYSPAAAKRALAEALDIMDGRHIVFGTDSANLEELYAASQITRRILAEHMAEQVERGTWSEEVALQAARRVLYLNATELYKLPNQP